MSFTFEIVDSKSVTKKIEQIEKILEPCWENPADLALNFLKRVDKVLFAFDSDKQLVGFHSWNVRRYEGAGNAFSAAYSGLGSIRLDLQKNRLGSRIMAKGFELARQDLHLYGKEEKKYMWWAVISPPAFRGLHKRFSHIQPRRDGHYNTESEEVVKTIKNTLGLSMTNPNPFLAKQMVNSSYRKSYWDKIQERTESQLSSLDNDQGDRLLLVLNVNQWENAQNRSLTKVAVENFGFS